MTAFRFCPECGTPLSLQTRFGAERPVCPACGYVHFRDPKVAAVTFVESQGRVLLVQRGVEPEKGGWALPAGYVDYGEAPELTAIRETAEETGLTVTIHSLLDVMFYQGSHPVIVIIYAATPTGGQLQAGDDALAAVWFAPDELPELAFESTRVIIGRWREGKLNFRPG